MGETMASRPNWRSEISKWSRIPPRCPVEDGAGVKSAGWNPSNGTLQANGRSGVDVLLSCAASSAASPILLSTCRGWSVLEAGGQVKAGWDLLISPSKPEPDTLHLGVRSGLVRVR